MSAFGGWIMSIVGCILLTALIDTLLEDGETKKFVKIVCSLLIFTVILTPITTLFSSDTSVLNVFDESVGEGEFSDYSFKEQVFLANLRQKEQERIKIKVLNSLEAKGIYGINLEVVQDYAKDGEILKIIVNANALVINDKNVNIDILKEIKDEVTSSFNVEESSVEILGYG